jgi:hypothetical protein
MDRLVIANIAERPTRAAASVFGVAIGIVLIVVTSGLSKGMLRSSAERESNVGAELLFQPPGSFGAGVTTTPLSLPVLYAEALAKLDGVRAATPVGRYVRSGAGGIGFELVEGIEFETATGHQTYSEITGLEIVEGREPEGDMEIVIDRQRAADGGTEIGSTIELFGRDFEVVGIYEPEIGARIKIPLASMQELLGTEGKCSSVLIKTSSPEIQEAVAALVERNFRNQRVGGSPRDVYRGGGADARDRDPQVSRSFAAVHRFHHREGSAHHQRDGSRCRGFVFLRGGDRNFRADVAGRRAGARLDPEGGDGGHAGRGPGRSLPGPPSGKE